MAPRLAQPYARGALWGMWNPAETREELLEMRGGHFETQEPNGRIQVPRFAPSGDHRTFRRWRQRCDHHGDRGTRLAENARALFPRTDRRQKSGLGEARRGSQYSYSTIGEFRLVSRR